MEKKNNNSGTPSFTTDSTGTNNNVSYNNNNLFMSPSGSHTDQLDSDFDFDFGSGELFNFNPTAAAAAPFSSLVFPPKLVSQSQLSYSSPSECSFDDDGFSVSNAMATESRLSQARFILEYQQLYNSYSMCLVSLQENVKEVEELRVENEALRAANGELVERVGLFAKAKRQSYIGQSGPGRSLVGDFGRLGIGSSFSESGVVADKVPSVSPTSVIEPGQFGRQSFERVSMPKSISVRSKGYLKSIASQPQIRQQATNASIVKSQLVRLPGEKKVYEGMEFEVYNQGMSKTELCNKWQETGACPYKDNCHFAHGISELRPVIRHPRYKTEVCRMVLAGDICPYGHRCHFRHTLTNEEMVMAVNPR